MFLLIPITKTHHIYSFDPPIWDGYNDPCPIGSSCPGDNPGPCAKGAINCPVCGTTNPQCCAGAADWTKYKAECRELDPDLGTCIWVWVTDTYVCSTADKCLSTSNHYLNAGECVCGTWGGPYKWCCNGSVGIGCTQLDVDGRYPFEGTCGGYRTVRCGGGGEPACDDNACLVEGPTNTPTPTLPPGEPTYTPVPTGSGQCNPPPNNPGCTSPNVWECSTTQSCSVNGDCTDGYDWCYAPGCCCKCTSGGGGCSHSYNATAFSITEGNTTVLGAQEEANAQTLTVLLSDIITLNATNLMTQDIWAVKRWNFAKATSPGVYSYLKADEKQEIKAVTGDYTKKNADTPCIFSSCTERTWDENDPNCPAPTRDPEECPGGGACTSDCSVYDTWANGAITIGVANYFTPGLYYIKANAYVGCEHAEGNSYIKLNVLPDPPSGLTTTCTCPSNQATLSWSPVFGADAYGLRVNNLAEGWDGSCYSASGDFCDNAVLGTSYVVHVTPGASYQWWLHSINYSSGWSDSTLGPDFSCCTAPSPTITPNPTTPVCTVSNRTQDKTCYKYNPVLSANFGATADQIQFAVDTDWGFANPWSCNSGWLSSNPSTYSSCSLVTRTLPYYWSARSQATDVPQSCLISSLTTPTPKIFYVDKTAPTPPVTPICSYNPASKTINFTWTPATDSNCLACGTNRACKYWLEGWWTDGTWPINNGEWAPANVNAPAYAFSCTGKDGQYAYLNVRQAKDNYSLPVVPTTDPVYPTLIASDNDSTLNYSSNSCRCPTSTPTPTFTPSPTPTAGPWKKISRGSYQSKAPTELDNSIPIDPITYDTDDSGGPYFIVNKTGQTKEAGVASAPEITIAPATIISSNDWSIPGYSSMFSYNKTTFLEYVNSRKTNKIITDLAEITADGIYQITANPTITNSFQHNVVLIVNGNVTINSSGIFNTYGDSLTIIANSITFNNTVTTANGIFVADTIITANVLTTNSLKIKGNLIAFSSLENGNRDLADNRKPSLFIVFDPKQYFALLPYLSIAKYDWQQLQ